MRNTILRNTIIGLLLCMSALWGVAQATAVDYTNSYKQSAISYQSSGYNVSATATAPTATFQSTSAYSGQWSEQSSMLNNDGSVNSGAYMTSGPRKAPGGGPGSSPGTPGGQLDPNAQQPLGDAVLPLLLLAMGYMMCRLGRRRKMVP